MSEKRPDSKWLEAKQSSPDTVFILFFNLNPLVSASEESNTAHPGIKLCRLDASSVNKELLQKSGTTVIFLGVEKQRSSSSSPPKEGNEPTAWFALNTDDNPMDHLQLTNPNSFFLKPPMPGLLKLSEAEAGEYFSGSFFIKILLKQHTKCGLTNPLPPKKCMIPFPLRNHCSSQLCPRLAQPIQLLPNMWE